MALTRKSLKAMGLTEEQIDSIIEMHTEVTDGLKAERDGYKEKADMYADVQKELNTAKRQITAAEEDPFKAKYDALKAEYDGYKTEQQEKETRTGKQNAYRALLKAAGLSDNRVETVLKVSDVNAIDFDENGEIKGKDDILNNIKKEWADFIVTTQPVGAKTAKPPMTTGGNTLTAADIYKKDDKGRYVLTASERQKAIAKNLENERK